MILKPGSQWGVVFRFFALAGILTLSVKIQAAVFWVAPDGLLKMEGTRQEPFNSVQQALEACRKLPPGETRRIQFYGGHYYDSAITLGPEDNGVSLEAIPGEQPVFVGGVRLTGWVKDGEKFYALPLPAHPPGNTNSWQIRMLVIDDRMLSRARYPAQGALTNLNKFEVPWMSTTGGGWKRPPTEEELTVMKYQAGDVPATLETANAEVTVYHMWDESSVGVATHDALNHILKLAPKPGHPPGAFGVRKYVLWNIREGLTQPGQWYHDRARNRIVYWPLLGQDMNRAQVIVPTQSSILTLKGTPQKKISGIKVIGLGFSVTSVPLVAAGFAAAKFEGAISVENAADCEFDRVMIKQVAGQGINGKGSLEKVRLLNSVISECGAGGVYLGGNMSTISNNHIHAIGRLYPSAVAIYRGGKTNLVSHNEVHDCTYSAMSYGGQGIVIEHNLFYDCMKVLHDGGAVYVFAAEGTIIRNNVARDIDDTGGYGSSAYYLDERSRNCVVENNLSLRVARPSHNHMATNNVVRGNVFITEGDGKITFPKSFGFNFTSNVFYSTGKLRFENPAAVTNWAGNFLFSAVGKIEQIHMKNYTGSLATNGLPPGCSGADPGFRDFKHGDLGYRPDSPVRKAGLPEHKFEHAGRLGKDGRSLSPVFGN
jgi:hypothetical protein